MANEDLVIIDCEELGRNFVVFYLGDKNDTEYWGDDWNDPLDNAGPVYERYVKKKVVVAFEDNYTLFDPSDVYYSSIPYSKQDMKERKIPCIIAVPSDSYSWLTNYETLSTTENAIKFYFGDKLDFTKTTPHKGTTILYY